MFFSCFNSAVAQEADKRSASIRFFIGGALEFGGDEIAEVYFTNGNSQTVRAGQGGSIAAGVQIPFSAAEKFLLCASAGFKYVTTEADNVHIRLTRVPLVLSGNYMATGNLRFSAGLTMHKSIRFKTDGIGDDVKFKPANGPIFEIAYAGIGLSYTAMKYRDNYNKSYSANAIGLTFSGAFPAKRTKLRQPGS